MSFSGAESLAARAAKQQARGRSELRLLPIPYRLAAGSFDGTGTDGVEIDDAGLRYRDVSQPLHVLLKQVLTQAAACALTLMMKSRAEWGTESALALAADAVARAMEEMRALRVPRQADRHFHHMQGAAEEVQAAIGLLRAGLRSDDEHLRDQLTQRLRAATGHLRAASRLMPGHPMADLSQACCAFHAREMLRTSA